MNEKIEHLIQKLTKVHNKIIVKYKNIEAIEGQYKLNLKTMARILRLQFEHQNEVYNMMLLDASSLDVDISEEGHKEILIIAKQSEEAIIKAMALDEENIVKTAIELSKIKIDLFKQILDILSRYEAQKNIKHEALQEKVMLIQKLEEKDYTTLLSFIKNNDL